MWQQSLKYISLYNTEGVPFSSEKRICVCVCVCVCVIKIRNIVLTISHC